MIENIKFSYKVADEQKNLFTPMHTLFKCKIQFEGKSFSFPFQCNTQHEQPKLETVLDCLLSDAAAYAEFEGDIDGFYREFGYSNIKDCQKAYNACKRTEAALNRLFGDKLIDLQAEIYD